jgi:hypothetical protein
MSSLDDRLKAFESKLKMDEEARFRINAKAVRLFGLWAAEKLGLQGAAAEDYAGEVVEADFDEPGIQDVLRKVKKDFSAKGIEVPDRELENHFTACLDQAKRQEVK